jgi:undecaprenyl-diphosphatase
MRKWFVIVSILSIAYAESFWRSADASITAALEGKNSSLYLDVAMEGLALATPFIEIGHAGFSQIENSKLSPLLAASLGVQLPILAGKYICKRQRPQRQYRPRLWNSRWTPSFPSGHAATTVAWAATISFADSKYSLPLAGYTLITGYSQVYVGNHYVSDVIAGWVVGYAVAFFSNNLINNKKYNTNESPQLRFSIPLP